MSLKSNLSLLLVLTAAASLGGCKKGDQGNAQPAGSGSAASGAAAAPAAPAGMQVDELLTKLVPTTCAALDECKNDKVKAIITMTGTMVASFGSIGKPELKKQMEGVDATMKKDKRWLPNKDECEKVGKIDLQLLGLTTGTLKPKIGKTVKYDGEKAAACLKVMPSLAECKTEIKLDKEPKLMEIDKFNDEVGKKMDAETSACHDMLSGMVDIGGDCEYGYECKGEHTQCTMDHNKKKKVCKADKHAK